MYKTKCPACNTYHTEKLRPNLKDKNFPLIECPTCGYQYVPEKLAQRIQKPYKEPKKRQIILCGLPVGIIGLGIIIWGTFINIVPIILVGGIIFSFYVMLIGMALSLWNEIISNSKKEYDLIQKASQKGCTNPTP